MAGYKQIGALEIEKRTDLSLLRVLHYLEAGQIGWVPHP